MASIVCDALHLIGVETGTARRTNIMCLGTFFVFGNKMMIDRNEDKREKEDILCSEIPV